MLGTNPDGEVVEQRRRDLQDVATALADQVVMGPVGKVEHGAARSELDALHDAEVDQHVEGPVHRALVELGVVGADGGDDVRRRHVVSGPPDEGVDDHPARPGHPSAAAAQTLDDVVGPLVGHHDVEATERLTVANRSLMHARSQQQVARSKVAIMRVIATAVSLALIGVGGHVGGLSPAAEDDDARLLVATTVAPITSIVANIVGDRADIEGIVPEGPTRTRSSRNRASPSCCRPPTSCTSTASSSRSRHESSPRRTSPTTPRSSNWASRRSPRTSTVYDFSFPEEGGKPNPHLWTNPPMALRYAEIVRDDMSARDPDNADYYAANYDAFAELIDELDGAMRESFATVPARKLLTYHDAYAYFAEEYDWDVIGAIQVSDFEDPTPREVAELIEQVEAERGAGDLRVRGVPQPGARADRPRSRRRVRRRAARRRPAW